MKRLCSMKRHAVLAVVISSFLVSGCGAHSGAPSNVDLGAARKLPTSNLAEPWKGKIKHIVIVVEENRSYQEIVGNSQAPYINSLSKQGLLLRNYHGVEHPSQPNYLDLFSGSNQGIQDDSCPHVFSAPNLASELLQKHLSFGGYSESLPAAGFTGCQSGGVAVLGRPVYARKHNPWVDFTNVPSRCNLPYSRFPSDFNRLPTVSFVVPNLNHDMHDGSIAQADSWLRTNLGAYAKWASQNNSLLIVTWDEDDQSEANHIPTLIVGATVRPGESDQPLNHFNLLRTIEDIFGLEYLAKSRSAAPIQDGRRV